MCVDIHCSPFHWLSVYHVIHSLYINEVAIAIFQFNNMIAIASY